jgi:rubredoxin
MLGTKECPLCGAVMQPKQTATVVQTPGNPGTSTETEWEWICPDCDYFEEVEEEGT